MTVRRRGQRPGIVHQDVETVVGGQELVGQPPHLVELAHVGEQVGDVGIRGCLEHRGHRPLGPVVAPGGQDHLGAEPGHGCGGGEARDPTSPR